MEINEDQAIARLAEALALWYGYPPAVARRIRIAALLHDIGKFGIADNILYKPGKLTRREFEIVKTHTTRGAEMLSSISGDIGVMIRDVCQYHHEWHNPALGGYWGISAARLPAYVSIVSICDVYMALTYARPYKEAWPPEAAIAYIRHRAGMQFNPALVGIFCKLICGAH